MEGGELRKRERDLFQDRGLPPQRLKWSERKSIGVKTEKDDSGRKKKASVKDEVALFWTC